MRNQPAVVASPYRRGTATSAIRVIAPRLEDKDARSTAWRNLLCTALRQHPESAMLWMRRYCEKESCRIYTPTAYSKSNSRFSFD